MGCKQSHLRGALEPAGGAPKDMARLCPSGPPGTPPLPTVPSGSWYAQPFEEYTSMPVSEFHIKQLGNVVFSNAYIPVSSTELDELPGHSPEVFETLQIGRDLIYGMGYFYNTPLYIEHRWCTRIVHFNKLCQDCTLKDLRKTDLRLSINPEIRSNDSDDHSRHSLEQLSKIIYDRPFFDTFVGIKVFVNDELVQDHYPHKKSIPNCTATIDSSEAFNNWICIPIVLIGFLNNFLLSTISLYRFLSLNFTEHMLRQCATTDDKKGCILENANESQTFHVRVEVVYGCRSQLNFCTEYISRGSLQVVMTEYSKAALKSYGEKLRKLIQSNPSGEQVVPIDYRSLIMQKQSLHRWCLFCKSPLRFTCSVCGAQVCGMPSCVWRPLTGYPHGCSGHKAQL